MASICETFEFNMQQGCHVQSWTDSMSRRFSAGKVASQSNVDEGKIVRFLIAAAGEAKGKRDLT